jgi:hypothetical protein
MAPSIDIAVGASAPEFVASLAAVHDSVRALRFKVYSPTPVLEERLSASGDDSMRGILAEAAKLRGMTGRTLFPYWESVLVAAAATEKSGLFMREAAKHDPRAEAAKRYEIPATEVASGGLDELVARLRPQEVVALCSTCATADGSVRHIPMMDFRLMPGAGSVEVVREMLEAVGQTGGVILGSGRSYHFYGLDLLERDDWLKFLARSLLLAPLTDARYIAHRILEGEGALRVTANEAKPRMPVVEYVL